MAGKTTEEPKQTLPVGHPQAGYVSPDLSLHEGTGTLPDKEVEWHEKRNDARDEEVEEVEQAEDKAAKEEAEQRAKDAEALREWQEKHGLIPPAPPVAGVSTPKSTTTKPTSSS